MRYFVKCVFSNLHVPIFILVIFLYVPEVKSQTEFPLNSGVIDVTKAPYHAKGDGVTDDTEAIQSAMDDYPNQARVIYLPAGTYLISDQINWPKGTSGGNAYKRTTLQGAGIQKTILKLKDNAPGYGNPSTGKAMLWTGTAPAQRFGNHIFDITVSTGKNNPGAIGIRFNASNQGGMRNVEIIDPGNSALIGLDMAYTDEIGPLWLKNIKITGFEVGIKSFWQVNSITIEDVEIKNQRTYGIHNYQQLLNIRNLRSFNDVPAIYNEKDGPSTITVLDSDFEHLGNPNVRGAIWNQKDGYFRNLRFSGSFPKAIDNDDKGRDCGDFVGGTLDELHSHCNPHSVFQSPETMMGLPIKEVPEMPWGNVSQWESPMDYGAIGDGMADDTEAVRAALNSGTETIYFPGGKTFNLNGTITISGPLKRIIGFRGTVAGNATFKFVDSGLNDAPTVIMERFRGGYTENIVVENASSRTIIASHMLDIAFIGNGTGDFFINDVVGRYVQIKNPAQKVWGRAINIETENEDGLLNDGGTLWVLGYKTEKDGIKTKTINGGSTEIYGTLVYNNTGDLSSKPAIMNKESNVSITGWREVNFNNKPYKTIVAETRGAVTRVIENTDKKTGSFFYVGYTDQPIVSPLPSTPSDLQVEKGSAQNSLIIKWGPSMGSVDSYVLERSTADTFTTLASIDRSTTEYIHTGLATGSEYCYRVRAVNSNGASPASNVGCATIQEITDDVPLPAPTLLTVSPNNGGGLRITWSGVADSADIRYRIEYRQDGGTFTALAQDESGAFFDHDGLEDSAEYCYRVIAYKGTEESVPTETVCKLYSFQVPVMSEWDGLAYFEADHLVLKFDRPIKNRVDIAMYKLDTKMVLRKSISLEIETSEIIVPVSQLASPALYLVRITNNFRNEFVKVMY